MTEPWVKTYSGGKPNYTEPCERCGEVNPAEIHTCTPKQREWMEQERAVGYREGHQAALKQRVWQGLTDEEIAEIAKIWLKGNRMLPFPLARAIEEKLKEKNA